MAKGKNKKKGSKKAGRKIVKVKAGSRTCHIAKKGRRFVLNCPNVKPIKLAMGVLGVQFASKKVAAKAKAAPSGGTIVANTAGDAVTVSGSASPSAPNAAEMKARLAAIKEAAKAGASFW